MKSIKYFFLSLLLVLLSNTILFSQDTHYWINQYGTSAQLLGGAVVGSVRDLSSTYYNPGAMTLSVDPTLVLATDAFEITQIMHENGLGDNKNLESIRLTTAPSIFAFRITYDSLRKSSMAISYLTRHDFNVELDAKRYDPRSTGNGSNNDRYTAGEVTFQNKMYEAWGGFTYSRYLNDNLSFGLTQYVAYRYQKNRFQAVGQDVYVSNDGAAVLSINQTSFYNVRLLTKIGIAINIKPFSIGLTLMSPSLCLFGNGSAYINKSLINVKVDTLPSGISTLASDYQKDLSSKFRSPLSVAVGGSYQCNNTALHVSVEYFARVKKFHVFKPETFYAQTSGEPINIEYTYELKPVFNYGFGVQHIKSKELAFYGGFTTDFSAFVPGSDGKFTMTRWDIYHITAGSSFTIFRIDMTLGAAYSFGKKSANNILNIDNFLSALNPGLKKVDSKFTYQRLKLMIGFSILI